MKYKYEYHRQLVANLRLGIIKDINTQMIMNNAREINLRRGIIFDHIDDQRNKVIVGVGLNGEVFIDEGNDVSLRDLSTDQLICVLEMIEERKFEVVEMIEEK
jgi:hypothetical protein